MQLCTTAQFTDILRASKRVRRANKFNLVTELRTKFWCKLWLILVISIISFLLHTKSGMESRKAKKEIYFSENFGLDIRYVSLFSIKPNVMLPTVELITQEP
jgi:hypothetical protein